MSATHFDLTDFGTGSAARQYYIGSVNVINKYLVEITFYGHKKPFMLGDRNLNVMIDEFGDSTDFWPGQAVWLRRVMATKEEREANPVIIGRLDVYTAKPRHLDRDE